MLAKQQIYERAKYLAFQFNKTGTEDFIIDATVYAGIYYGTGGKRHIDIPPFMDIPMGVVVTIVKAKSRFGNDITRNLIVLKETLNTLSNGLLTLRVDGISSKSVQISIIRTDNNATRTLMMSRRLNDDDLTNIGLAILDLYGNCGLELQHKKEKFTNTLRRLIAYV